jgi:hypothetical protein
VLPRRVGELERVAVAPRLLGLGQVGRADDELDLARAQLGRQLLGRPEPLGDRLREGVLVAAEQQQAPEPVGPEHVLRLERQQETLAIVEPVERRQGTVQRAGRRPEDPADSRPECALADPPKESEFHQGAIDAAARQDERRVPSVAHAHRIHYP